VCSDLGVRFNSPTVNLSMSAKDYLKFVKNLKYYLSTDIVENTDLLVNYPVGILGEDITLHFMHYRSFDDAVSKWNERKVRVNFDNIFYMMTDRDGCTEEDIKEFDSLPFEHKLLFSANPYPQYKSVVCCEEFREDDCVPVMTEWRNMWGERLYDRYFDFVKWFNGD
jgi:uncharacterized protein (DUF1919 family)